MGTWWSTGWGIYPEFFQFHAIKRVVHVEIAFPRQLGKIVSHVFPWDDMVRFMIGAGDAEDGTQFAPVAKIDDPVYEFDIKMVRHPLVQHHEAGPLCTRGRPAHDRQGGRKTQRGIGWVALQGIDHPVHQIAGFASRRNEAAKVEGRVHYPGSCLPCCLQVNLPRLPIWVCRLHKGAIYDEINIKGGIKEVFLSKIGKLALTLQGGQAGSDRFRSLVTALALHKIDGPLKLVAVVLEVILLLRIGPQHIGGDDLDGAIGQFGGRQYPTPIIIGAATIIFYPLRAKIIGAELGQLQADTRLINSHTVSKKEKVAVALSIQEKTIF